MENKDKNITIKNNNKNYQYPIIKSNLGLDGVQISNIKKDLGIVSYDPSFMSTAACKSSITYLDGENGILKHRGYDIIDLVNNCSFLEVCYLLINKNLPTQQQLNDFCLEVNQHREINSIVKNIYKGFDSDAHPMAIICSVTSALSAVYHKEYKNDLYKNKIRIIAKIPTIIAYAYRHIQNKEFINPNINLEYVENIIHMLFGKSNNDSEKINPIFTKALNTILILHADHEQNASTSTVRCAGSSGANHFACIAAGMVSLWGPAHGGANEAVLNMLEEIGSIDNVNTYINKAKDKNDPFRLMGFGHRIYKNYDPRAKIMQTVCREVLEFVGEKNNLLSIAKEIEKIALQDEYFINRQLYPNVDFYSGIIMNAIGIDKKLFTCIFAMARTVGWTTHLYEMLEDQEQKISRPLQIYIGQQDRKFIPISER